MAGLSTSSRKEFSQVLFLCRETHTLLRGQDPVKCIEFLFNEEVIGPNSEFLMAQSSSSLPKSDSICTLLGYYQY